MLTIILFFIVALIYSSAGLAGGSSYLALLFLLDHPIEQVAAIALVCNIVVSSVGTGIFSVAKALDLRSLQWFLLGSIPAAYLGGRIQLPVETLKFVLGGALIFCSAWIFLTTINLPGMRVQKTRPRQILVGAGIGLLSGLVGIGGGIFLAPVLILFQWDEAKRVSALTAAFILLNSLSGIFGKLAGPSDLSFLFAYRYHILAVSLGGLVGPYLSLYRLSPLFLKRTTAFIIFIAALRLTLKF